MAFSSNGSNGLPPQMAEINVTPLVDVVLVLLIIFMVSAPLFDMSQGVNLDLPETEAANTIPPSQVEPIVISLDAKGAVSISKTVVPLEELEAKVRGILANEPRRDVLFMGDRAVPYGVAVDVMARLKQAGVTSLGMVTQPPEPRK